MSRGKKIDVKTGEHPRSGDADPRDGTPTPPPNLGERPDNAGPEGDAAGQPNPPPPPTGAADARDTGSCDQDAFSLEGELEQLRSELNAAQDHTLRTQAELENYRRRVAREMEQERRYASMPLLRDLLPVWDNVNRAIEAAENASGAEGIVEGFRMVATQMEDVLRRHECVRIEAVNQPFDPNFHEAITQQPAADVPPQTVLAETQVGFRLHDRVVRPSQVIVSTPVEE